MSDSDAQGLRGPVRRISIESSESYGLRTEEHIYDRNGSLKEYRVKGPDGSEHVTRFQHDAEGVRINRNVEVLVNSDGSRTEVYRVQGEASWSMASLHWCGFPTFGAAFVRTRFDREGKIIDSIFQNNTRKAVSRIDYVCDEGKRITEAVQRRVAGVHSLASILAQSEWSDRSSSGSKLSRDAEREEFSVTFEYDRYGRVVVRKTHFAGRETHRTVRVFNDEGDVVRVEQDGRLILFEYEYDEHGNWIRKVEHSAGSGVPREYYRDIDYYET